MLTYWRRRLAGSDRPNPIFDAVRELVAQTGVLKGKTRRVLNSAVLDAAVATQDRHHVAVEPDTGLFTGGALTSAALIEAGHTPVIKPGPLCPAVPGGFAVDDFTVSEGDGTVTCPNGLTRRIPTSRTVTFGAGCTGCL